MFVECGVCMSVCLCAFMFVWVSVCEKSMCVHASLGGCEFVCVCVCCGCERENVKCLCCVYECSVHVDVCAGVFCVHICVFVCVCACVGV